MLRGVLALLAVCVAATLVASPVRTSPSATTTISCKQVWTGFNVQLTGDRDNGTWFLGEGLEAAQAPGNKALIAVWSLGGKLRGGLNVHEWVAAKRSRSSPDCTVVKAALKPASLSGLGQVWRTKNGWAFGRRFLCLDPGRILISRTPSSAKTKVVVRMQSSGKTIAVGELAKGGGWIRGSKSCDDKER